MGQQGLTKNKQISISIAFLLVLAGFVFTGASWKTGIDDRIATLERTTTEVCDVQKTTLEKQAVQDVRFAEIQTDLKWIRATLEKQESN